MSLNRLKVAYSRFLIRSDSVLRLFLSLDSKSPKYIGTVYHQNARYFLIHRLLHLWSEFCRSVVVMSALGNCLSLSEQLIPAAPGISSYKDVSVLVKPRLSGPGTRWENPSWASYQASQLGVTNQSQLSLGFGGAPFNNYRIVRNFVIHPNSFTRSEYVQLTRNFGKLGLGPEALLVSPVAGGATQLETWVIDFQVAALNAIR